MRRRGDPGRGYPCLLYTSFGKDNFFLELQDHGLPDQKLVNQGLMRMSRDTGLKLVATNDIHYTFAEDEKAHDILLCIQTGKKVADEDRICLLYTSRNTTGWAWKTSTPSF